MKQSFAMIVLILGLSVISFGQPADKKQSENEKIEQDLIQLDRQWAELAVRGDITAFDRIIADEHVSTFSNGKLVTRDEDRAYIATSAAKYQSITTDDVKIRVYGDTAIIIGRVMVKTRSGSEAQYRYTTVWVKRQHNWQIVAEQHTSISKQQPSQ
ncbi:MAG: nuclear transport factor 2 family protein [Acidobacteriota bacterium]